MKSNLVVHIQKLFRKLSYLNLLLRLLLASSKCIEILHSNNLICKLHMLSNFCFLKLIALLLCKHDLIIK